MGCGSTGERSCRVAVRLSEIDPELMGLLQVPSENLVLVGRCHTRAPGKPRGIALVEIGAHLLQDSPVGGVPDQRVVEPEQAVVRPPRAVGVH